GVTFDQVLLTDCQSVSRLDISSISIINPTSIFSELTINSIFVGSVTCYAGLAQRLSAWIEIKIISFRITLTSTHTQSFLLLISPRIKGALPGLEPKSAKARHSNKRLGFTTPPLERPDYTNPQRPEGSALCKFWRENPRKPPISTNTLTQKK
ncbi:hypothetical protein PROFUN_03044, partial [Planoprotostelium fungivorum]